MVQWRVHGERTVYESPWVSVVLVTVEPPGVEPFEHHVTRAPSAAGCIVTGPDGVLLIYRHRFINDAWGWEIPAGHIDAGETPAEAAVRETLEETGWRCVGSPEAVTRFHPSNGSSELTFHIFHVDEAEHVGEPADATEASEVAWKTIDEIRAMMANGEITDGLTLTGLSVALATGVLTA